MGGEGSALGSRGGRGRRADYLYSFPMFMGCPVRHRTRSRCVGAIQDYLWGHVRRAAPGGSSLPFTFPCELSIHCPATELGVGSLWTDFLSPIKSGLLLEEEDLIFPKMQSATFSAAQL